MDKSFLVLFSKKNILPSTLAEPNTQAPSHSVFAHDTPEAHKMRVGCIFDPAKDKANRLKHGVSLGVGEILFAGPHLSMTDDRFKYGEVREVAAGLMATGLSEAARAALAATDWRRIDAMTDEDVARQISANQDAAPDIDARAIRRAAGMPQAQFASTYAFSIRTIQQWEHGAKKPSGPARTLLRAIKGDPPFCSPATTGWGTLPAIMHAWKFCSTAGRLLSTRSAKVTGSVVFF